MTFSYDPTNPSDLVRVRYHLQDTEEDTAIFTDETILFVLDEEVTVGKAVISLIHSAMAKLASEPDMTADWLRVDWRGSREAWRVLLSEKKQKFGLGWAVSGTATHVYRVDSLQDEEPTYERDDDD